MVISVDEHRLAYAAVPKAGCTTVKMMLAQIDPESNWAPSEDGSVRSIHGEYQTMRFRLRRWQNHQDFYRFTVVRDPLSRILAVYSNRVLQKGDLKKSRRFRNGRAGLPVEPDPDFFFQHLSEYCAASSSIQHHARSTAAFTGRRLGRYSRVYRTRELVELARDLSELTGRDVTMPHANKSSVRLTIDDLTSKTVAALRSALTFEYKFLARYFDNPFV